MLEKAGFRVKVGGGGPMPRAALLRRARDVDGVLAMLSDRIDEAFLAACPRVRVVANYAVGHDNIDLEAARRHGVLVTNTPDVLTGATAELAWALILACARRVIEADAYTRRGRFRGWGPLLLLGRELSGKTLGIVGAGRIGRAVGRIGRAFGMKVVYAAWRGKGMPLDRLLRSADVVSVHVPLTAATRGLLDARRLALLKPTAIVVNTARGPVVDEGALVDLLRRGRIASAGLDVYAREPALHPGLKRLDRVVLLPHIGSATVEARAAMAVRAAANLVAGLRGRKPRDLLT